MSEEMIKYQKQLDDYKLVVARYNFVGPKQPYYMR